jgi:2-(1,2-epoxy-1,2-dihydrophenyl)acetyl-CoA isomerase
MMPTFSNLLIDRPARHVLRVLINRPEKRNAIYFDVRQQLTETFDGFGADEEIRAIVIGGAGGHFSAGGDLPSMLDLSETEARGRMRHIAALCHLVRTCTLPIVTAMEGFCAGACVGLALLGDHIVVGEGTKILFPFMKLGLVPDWGLMCTLPQRVGMPTARRLLVSGATLAGPEANSLNLADDLVVDGEVMRRAVCRAEEYAALPRDAFTRMKSRFNAPSSSWHEEFLREEEDQTVLLRGRDFREGYAAFFEKRSADFTKQPLK